MTTTLIMLLPALFVFSVMLYIHIKEKQLSKAISELESEQQRMKLIKKSYETLKDVMTRYEKSKRKNNKQN